MKIWPKRFQDGPKSVQGTEQEPPKRNIRADLGSNGVQTQSNYAPWTYLVFECKFEAHFEADLDQSYLELTKMPKEDAKH